MSKYVKDLITNELKSRLEGVEELLLIDLIGLENNKNVALRKRLREKEINVLVVKNSLARRATEGTALRPAFEDVHGSCALCWGAEDIVSLAKEVNSVLGDTEFEPISPKGGVLDGQSLGPDDIKKISKWPSRTELISLVAGQAVGVPSEIAGQLIGSASELASQIEKLIEMKEEAGE